VRSYPPQNWQPLVEPATESRRRKWILGLTTLAAVLGIGATAAVIGLAVFAWNDVPEGYSASDTCWVSDGAQSVEGEPLQEVPCSLEHDYISGETVSDQNQCPVNSPGYLQEGDQVICLTEPR
jgi:hypothetical protein